MQPDFQSKTFIPTTNTRTLYTTMIKNNPYEVLKEAGIAKSMMTGKAKDALVIFDRAFAMHEKRPKSEDIATSAEEVGKRAIAFVQKEIERINTDAKQQAEEKISKEARKHQSKQIAKKSEVILDGLAECRKKLREDRQRRIESGEIQPPKKKTLNTKLRGELMKFAGLIPKKLQDDQTVIKRTQRAILNFLNELKAIWGMDKIKPIEEDLIEKFKKLQHEK